MTYRRGFFAKNRASHRSIRSIASDEIESGTTRCCGSCEGPSTVFIYHRKHRGQLKRVTKSARRLACATKNQSSLYRLRDRHRRSYLPLSRVLSRGFLLALFFLFFVSRLHFSSTPHTPILVGFRGTIVVYAVPL